MSPIIKKIIIIAVVLGVLYLAYSMFFKKSDTDTLISGADGLGTRRNLADTQVLGNQITQALIQIESLNLDKSVFSNPIYLSLIDKSEPIIPEPIGRRNPFAPLTDTSVNYDTDISSDLPEGTDLGDLPPITEEVPTTTPDTLPPDGLVQ
jgi:hypothetical protein